MGLHFFTFITEKILTMHVSLSTMILERDVGLIRRHMRMFALEVSPCDLRSDPLEDLGGMSPCLVAFHPQPLKSLAIWVATPPAAPTLGVHSLSLEYETSTSASANLDENSPVLSEN